ncbi:hypothetical protein VNO77_42801 [Canavalia gladiata]|uniref:Uncharacterized protein n=1 Tax=Canavalia gladiata TaxID=3824 RepID=A0AAN9PPE0_CANGL
MEIALQVYKRCLNFDKQGKYLIVCNANSNLRCYVERSQCSFSFPFPLSIESLGKSFHNNFGLLQPHLACTHFTLTSSKDVINMVLLKEDEKIINMRAVDLDSSDCHI